MNLLRKFISFSLLTTFALNSYSASIDNSKFLRDYQKIVSQIIQEYNNQELSAQIFDISKKSYLDFLTSSTNYKKPGTQDIMGMQYYSKMKVNNKDTALCFILYDSKSNLVENYQKHTNFTIDEITEYLALHEMGHCLIMNQQYQLTGKMSDPRTNELMADKFTIYKLFENGKTNLIEKILRINSTFSDDGIHKNDVKLEQFYKQLKANNIAPKQAYEKLITFIIDDSH